MCLIFRQSHSQLKKKKEKKVRHCISVELKFSKSIAKFFVLRKFYLFKYLFQNWMQVQAIADI